MYLLVFHNVFQICLSLNSQYVFIIRCKISCYLCRWLNWLRIYSCWCLLRVRILFGLQLTVNLVDEHLRDVLIHDFLTGFQEIIVSLFTPNLSMELKWSLFILPAEPVYIWP